MLGELMSVFGIANPLSTVVEFIIVVFAVGYGYNLIKDFGKK